MRRLVLASSLSWIAACGPQTPATQTPEDGAITAVPPSEPALPEAEALLAEAVDAIGGRAALDKVRSFYSETKIEIPSQSLRGTARVWWKAGDFYLELDMDGIGTTRTWKRGADVWADDPIQGRRKLEGLEAQQAKWSASVAMVAEWKQHFDKAEIAGRRDLAGKPAIDVRLSGAEGAEMILTIDEATHLVVEQGYTQTSPMGSIPVRVTMSDYRDVAGVKTSFRSEMSLTIMTMVSTVQTFEANVPVDDAKFTPPPA
jgi:hypothetical protein